MQDARCREDLPLCMEAVGVFYRPSRLAKAFLCSSHIYIYIYIERERERDGWMDGWMDG